MMPEKKKPVGIWIRVSTEEQVQGESPEHHERRARAYAEAKGWQVTTVYDLAGVSDKTVAEHPETLRMREDVESGRVEALIFSKLARLAGNTRELLDLSDYFREQKAGLVSLDEAIDTSTPTGPSATGGRHALRRRPTKAVTSSSMSSEAKRPSPPPLRPSEQADRRDGRPLPSRHRWPALYPEDAGVLYS